MLDVCTCEENESTPISSPGLNSWPNDAAQTIMSQLAENVRACNETRAECRMCALSQTKSCGEEAKELQKWKKRCV